MSIAAIYVRKSKFTGKGESIQNQIDMCKQYASDRSIEIKEGLIYHDEGFSGGNIDRPEFKRLIKDVKKKKFDVLICYRLDRISRSISDFSTTLDLLKKHDISFVSIREQFDTSTPMGRAMMYIASVFAQLERETIAERIRDNMLRLARTGRWLGGVTPTGFISESIKYFDSEMRERKMFKLSQVKDELKIVEMLYSKYLEFSSLSKLETYCLQNHITSKNGNDFQKNTLRSILTNPVYAIADKKLYEYFRSLGTDIASDESEFDGKHGVLVYNKTEETKGSTNKLKDTSEWILAVSKHKGIISSENWIRVQGLLEKNKSKAPRQGSSSKGLLSGLIRCGKCNAPMRVKRGQISKKTGDRLHYYVCSLKELSKGTRCDNTNLKGDLADEIVINKIKEMIQKSDGLLSNISNIENEVFNDEKNNIKAIKQVKQQLKDNEKAIENLVSQISEYQNSHAAKYLIKKIEELDQGNVKLKESLNISNKSFEKVTTDKLNLDIIKDTLLNFNKLIDSADIDSKKRLLHNIVDSIYWNDGDIQINLFNSKKKL